MILGIVSECRRIALTNNALLSGAAVDAGLASGNGCDWRRNDICPSMVGCSLMMICKRLSSSAGSERQDMTNDAGGDLGYDDSKETACFIRPARQHF